MRYMINFENLYEDAKSTTTSPSLLYLNNPLNIHWLISLLALSEAKIGFIRLGFDDMERLRVEL